MSFVSLNETELVRLVDNQATSLYQELIEKEVETDVKRFRVSLWEQLGSARNRDQLFSIISNKQNGHRTFDPTAFDQHFSLRVGDHAVLISDLKTGSAEILSITHIEEDMGEYFYRNGMYLDGFPLNHFISPDLFRGIDSFVNGFVEQYKQKIITERKTKYLEVLRRERRPLLKSYLLFLGGLSLWEGGLDKLQREFSDKLEVDDKSPLFQDIMFSLLLGNRYTYAVNPTALTVGTKYCCIKKELLDRPAKYVGVVVLTADSDGILNLERNGSKPVPYSQDYFLFDLDTVALLQIDAYANANKARKLLIEGLLKRFQ